MAIFQQAVGHEPDLSDKNQAFLQEALIRHGKQMNIVTYLKATVDDVAKFCSGQGQFFKTLAMDTTFNIAEYYFTQIKTQINRNKSRCSGVILRKAFSKSPIKTIEHTKMQQNVKNQWS